MDGRCDVITIRSAPMSAASSSTSLIFFIEDDVFVYLLNGIVDGFLVFASLLLWLLAGRVGAPAAPP